VMWKHALALRCSDQVLRLALMPPAETRLGGAEPYVRVVRAEAWFAFLLEREILLSLEETQAYLAVNKDIPKIKDPNCTCRLARLFVPDKPDLTSFFLVQAVPAEPGAPAAAPAAALRYLYFNTRSHLKWHLQQSKGLPFEDKHNTLWHRETEHLLVAGRNVYSPYDDNDDSGGFMLMHRIESHDGGRTLALDVADHDDRLVQAELAAIETCKTRVAAIKKWIRDAESGVHEPCDAVLEERRALLSVRLAEHAQQVMRSAGVKMTRTVRFHLALCASADFRLEWTLGPLDNWRLDGACGLGVIKKHPPRAADADADAAPDADADGVYLRRGHYYVECLFPGQDRPSHALMDFVTASRCLVREGQSVFLRLHRARYSELCACVQKSMRRSFAMRAPGKVHKALCGPQADTVQLEAFYILGDGAHEDADRHVVRLAVIVHSLNLMDGSYFYNEQDKHKVIVNVRLVDSENAPIVTLHADSQCETFSNLIYTSKSEAARVAQLPPLAGAAEREVWLT